MRGTLRVVGLNELFVGCLAKPPKPNYLTHCQIDLLTLPTMRSPRREGKYPPIPNDPVSKNKQPH